MRARYDINVARITREQHRIADRTSSRAASITQMRVKEGIALTDRVRTGKMLNRVHVRQVAPARYQVRSDEPYSHWQERGRGPVRPVRAKALRFKPKGAEYFVFAQYVRPDPGGHFFKRALQLARVEDFTG